MTSSKFIAVPGSERVPVPGAHAVAAADAEAWLEVTIKLARRTPLPALEGGRPAAALSRAELGAKFGAAPEVLQRVADAFAPFGLTEVSRDAATRSLKLAGPVSAMEQAFQVKLMQFEHPDGNYRGRVGPLHVPAEVAADIEGVFGLDNRRVAHRRPGARGRRLLAPQDAKAASKAPKARAWFYPAEVAAAYDFPEGDGSGQVIGLLEFGGGFFASDLAAFVKQANVPATATVVPVSVDQTPTDTNDDATGEVMLDVEVVAGICPKATIPVYFGQFTEKGWVDVLDAAVHDTTHQPQVLSISWGYAEDAYIWTAAAVKQVNESLQEAALLGVTVCVSAGDDGSSDGVTDGHAHVDFPSSSPYVLAVGGTLLRTHPKRSERAWKDGDGLRADNGGSTGGGVSTRLARPTWQAGLDIAPVNPGQIAGRITPDVAANASANTGYFTVSQGQAGVTGGTSASSPLWAALVALVNQNLPAGKHAGYLAPLLYGAGTAGKTPLGSQVCNDIATGDNITAKVGGFKAGKGYDAVTGWGSPKGKELLAALSKLV